MTQRHQLVQSTLPRLRRAIATLEVVFCLPILLALIVGIVWLGSSVIAQTEVTVEARHKAWSKRENQQGTALNFLQDDFVKESAEKQVESISIFDSTDSPASKHVVMAGSWDHRKLPLDRAPNWKAYAMAAANAKTGNLQIAYVDASNRFTSFKSQSRSLWRTIGEALIRQITGLGDSVRDLLRQGQDEESGNKSQEQARIESKLSAKRKELTEAESALKELEDDASKALRNVLKNRVKRIKSDIQLLEDDLEAIE